MHEVGLAAEILDRVCARAAGAHVSRVVVEVGALAAVMPDALRFAFEIAREGTEAFEATLDVVEIGAPATCDACARSFVARHPLEVCSCGAVSITFHGGDDLRIREIEIRDGVRSCA